MAGGQVVLPLMWSALGDEVPPRRWDEAVELGVIADTGPRLSQSTLRASIFTNVMISYSSFSF